MLKKAVHINHLMAEIQAAASGQIASSMQSLAASATEVEKIAENNSIKSKAYIRRLSNSNE